MKFSADFNRHLGSNFPTNFRSDFEGLILKEIWTHFQGFYENFGKTSCRISGFLKIFLF